MLQQSKQVYPDKSYTCTAMLPSVSKIFAIGEARFEAKQLETQVQTARGVHSNLTKQRSS